MRSRPMGQSSLPWRSRHKQLSPKATTISRASSTAPEGVVGEVREWIRYSKTVTGLKRIDKKLLCCLEVEWELWRKSGRDQPTEEDSKWDAEYGKERKGRERNGSKED